MALGAVSMMQDLGVQVGGVLHADSSAAKGLAARKGFGKVKHMDIRYMWVQDMVRSGRLELVKIPGGENAADMMTKCLEGPAAEKCMKRLACEVAAGRHALAPALSSGAPVAVDDESPDDRD